MKGGGSALCPLRFEHRNQQKKKNEQITKPNNNRALLFLHTERVATMKRERERYRESTAVIKEKAVAKPSLSVSHPQAAAKKKKLTQNKKNHAGGK